MINVSNIILRLRADLIKRIILIILKLRSTDMAVPTLVKRFIYSKIAPIAVNITTTQSKILKVSLKYDVPKAINLRINSKAKTNKKNKLE